MIVENGCKKWRALEKWTDNFYLKREYGLQSIVINKLERPLLNNKPNKNAQYHFSSLSSKRNSFAHYLNNTQEDNDGTSMYFLKNEMMVSRNL
jgi:hypothetical protein